MIDFVISINYYLNICLKRINVYREKFVLTVQYGFLDFTEEISVIFDLISLLLCRQQELGLPCVCENGTTVGKSTVRQFSYWRNSG